MLFLTRRIDVSIARDRELLRRIRAAFAAALIRIRVPARPGAPLVPSRNVARPSPLAAHLAALDERFGTVASAGDGEPAHADAMGEIAAAVLDASALWALERGDAVARRTVARIAATGGRIVVPAVALLDPRAGAVPHDAFEIVAIDAAIAREAARILAAAHVRLPLDALTVACAPGGARTAVLTNDPAGAGAMIRASGRPDLIAIAVGR